MGSSHYIDAGCAVKSRDLYFAGRQIRAAGVTQVTDRLGSVRVRSDSRQMSYFPYGEERTNTVDDGTPKFGTYIREFGGGDYADQRYYANGGGRFMTPDPYSGSADSSAPQSWNRFVVRTR